jgi:hypothetical protein
LLALSIKNSFIGEVETEDELVLFSGKNFY